ncbi:MAG: hypothetical protein ACKO1N_04895, partial [Erythrobacter sp.]
MTFSADLLGLGSMIALAVIGAWALGRWQGGLGAADMRNGAMDARIERDHRSPGMTPGLDPSAPARQHDTRAERQEALAEPGSLAALHAEITAYRKAEKILTRADGEAAWLMSADCSATIKVRV